MNVSAKKLLENIYDHRHNYFKRSKLVEQLLEKRKEDGSEYTYEDVDDYTRERAEEDDNAYLISQLPRFNTFMIGNRNNVWTRQYASEDPDLLRKNKEARRWIEIHGDGNQPICNEEIDWKTVKNMGILSSYPNKEYIKKYMKKDLERQRKRYEKYKIDIQDTKIDIQDSDIENTEPLPQNERIEGGAVDILLLEEKERRNKLRLEVLIFITSLIIGGGIITGIDFLSIYLYKKFRSKKNKTPS